MPEATAVRERPIIFKPDMVRALMREVHPKTQTRRIIDPQPKQVRIQGGDWVTNDGQILRCPYGMVGDRLWVKENFYVDHVDYANGERLPKVKPDWWEDQAYFPADAKLHGGPWCCQLIPECCCSEVGKPKLRPSIFMPRWASRLNLEILKVRVERAHRMMEKDRFNDAMAEGMLFLGGMADNLDEAPWADPGDPKEEPWRWPQGAFAAAWRRINGKKSWDSNPWCWVLDVKRIVVSDDAAAAAMEVARA